MYFDGAVDYIDEQRAEIKVIFLSPYIQELNPQEYVNLDLKTNIVGERSPIKMYKLLSYVESFMHAGKSDSMHVQKYFHLPYVRCSAYPIYPSILHKRLIVSIIIQVFFYERHVGYDRDN